LYDWAVEVEFRRSINPKTGVVNTTDGWPVPNLKVLQGGFTGRSIYISIKKQ